MPNRKSRETRPLFDTNPLPDFASTPEQIRRAVQRNAVQRGQFYALNLAVLGLDQILERVDQLAQDIDVETWYEAANTLGIDIRALQTLDSLSIRFPYYFCEPSFFQNDPTLAIYYRNVAMTSAKVMRGIGLETDSLEKGATPSNEKAQQLTLYLNSTLSKLIVENPGLITQRRHIEMALTNMGESLGGSWRNEIGRLAYVELMRVVITFFHEHHWLSGITYDLKGPISNLDDDETSVIVVDSVLPADPNLLETVVALERNRIVYKSIQFTNGTELLLNRQMIWADSEGNNYRIGPDLSAMQKGDVLSWSGELKGGADPAGSDEHWKTASRAFERILEAAEKTGRPKPKLSFIATILVDRVAREAAMWIENEKLYSVYNLTQIIEDSEKRRKFLFDVAQFLGYETTETTLPSSE